MAEEKSQARGARGEQAQAQQGGDQPAGRPQDPATREALDANREAREAADEQVGPQQGRVPLPDQDAPAQVVQTQTLAGVEPVGVRDAGGAEQHAALVAGDEHAYAAVPGGTGPEAVGSGQPLPVSAQEAQQARAAAGIPEPPKVGPVPNVSLYDTPGGYQTVPAGFTPEELAGVQSAPRPRAGTPVSSPFGEEAGAVNRHIAGAAPGERTAAAE